MVVSPLDDLTVLRWGLDKSSCATCSIYSTYTSVFLELAHSTVCHFTGGLSKQPRGGSDSVCLSRRGQTRYAKHRGGSQQSLHQGPLVSWWWEWRTRPGTVSPTAAASASHSNHSLLISFIPRDYFKPLLNTSKIKGKVSLQRLVLEDVAVSKDWWIPVKPY